jgi:hypothetical protein
VDAAITAAAVGLTEAQTILTSVAACHLDADAAGELEEVLIDHATRLSERELTRLCREVIARLQPENATEREELLRSRSGLRIVHLPDGLTRFVIDAHPEAAGYLTTALDARTAPRRQPHFRDTLDNDSGSDVTADTRTTARRRLDALVSIARESLTHDPGDIAGTPVTMMVTVTLDNLRTGLGDARIEGIDEPISAATARRLAATADITPPSSAPKANPSTSAEPSDSSRGRNAEHSPAETKAAPGPDATPHPRGAKSHISSPGTSAAQPTSPTEYSSAPSTTAASTTTAGPSDGETEAPTSSRPPWIDSTQTPRRGGPLPHIAA